MQKMMQMLSKFHNATDAYTTLPLNDDIRVLIKKLYKNIIEDDLVRKLSRDFVRSSNGFYNSVVSRYPEHLMSDLSLNEEGIPTPSFHYDITMFEFISDKSFEDQDLVGSIHESLNNLLNIENKNISFTVNVQHPGQFTYLHYDSSIILPTKEELKDADYLPDRFTRGVIFLKDWEDGQVCQLGKDFLKWKELDAIRYWDQARVVHGFSNFGFTDRVSMLVTWDK